MPRSSEGTQDIQQVAVAETMPHTHTKNNHFQSKSSVIYNIHGYTCIVCEKCFAWLGNLQRRKNSDHNIQNCLYDVCVAHNNQNYAYDVCGQLIFFSYFDALTIHKRNQLAIQKKKKPVSKPSFAASTPTFSEAKTLPSTSGHTKQTLKRPDFPSTSAVSKRKQTASRIRILYSVKFTWYFPKCVFR